MTENHFIGGASSLQNELIKLLSENGDIDNTTNNDVDNITNDENSDMEEMRLNEIIKDSVETQNMLDAQYVNQELSGGTSIVGIVDNILAGGNLNNSTNSKQNNAKSNNANMKPNENRGEDIISNIYENSNGDNKGEEIIENIYENSPNDSKLKGGKINKSDNSDDNEDPNYDPDMDESNDENDNDEDDDINSVDSVDSDDSDDEEERNGFIKIINEMREYAKENEVPRPNSAIDSSNSSFKLSGGNIKPANRVRILNMYPYILKSID